VHEAYLRLVGGEETRFENRAHFFGAAAAAIRRVLVEHSRRRARLKRGDGRVRVELDAIDPAAPVSDEDLLALEEALEELTTFSPESARLVELRFFAGMTIPEVAQVLRVSESTIERDWRLARAWLKGKLEERHGS
jgi:RNA polymerase sigma factor (TIGR02999 family)